jgi:hypothetical protein
MPKTVQDIATPRTQTKFEASRQVQILYVCAGEAIKSFALRIRYLGRPPLSYSCMTGPRIGTSTLYVVSLLMMSSNWLCGMEADGA